MQDPAPAQRDDRRNDVVMGLFTIIAFGLMLAGWMWFKSFPLDSVPQRFSISFSNVAGLTDNAAVYVDGVRVGAVETIDWVGKNNVVVGVKINKKNIRVPQGSTFKILTNGIVGAKYIQVGMPEGSLAHLPLLTAKSIAVGSDPVPIEQVLDSLAISASQIDFGGMQDSMDRNFERMGAAADKVAALSSRLSPAADRALIVENKIARLADTMSGTSRRLNRIIDNPKTGPEIKLALEKAHQASERIQTAMSDMKSTLSDTELRADVLAALNLLKDSTESVRVSLSKIGELGADTELRTDLKHIVGEAHETIDAANRLVEKPLTGPASLKGTLKEAREAISNFNTVGKQLTTILDSRAPLLRMLVGRPGRIDKLAEREFELQRERDQAGERSVIRYPAPDAKL